MIWITLRTSRRFHGWQTVVASSDSFVALAIRTKVCDSGHCGADASVVE